MVLHRNVPTPVVEVAWDVPYLTRPDSEDWVRLDQDILVDPFAFWGGELVQWGDEVVVWGDGDPIDVAPCIRSLDTEIGIRTKTGESEPGTATSVWGDHFGVLNRLNPSGPLAAEIKKCRRVQFTLEPEDGDPEVVYTGFLDRLSPSWDVGDSTVTMECVDLLAVLADVTLPPSVLDVAMRDLAPVSYWPMTETAGQHADDVVGTGDGIYQQPVTGTGAVVPFDSRPCVVSKMATPAGADGQWINVPVVGSSEISIGIWFQWGDGIPPSVITLADFFGDDGYVTMGIGPIYDIDDQPTGEAIFSGTIGVGSDVIDLFSFANIPVFDAASHFMVLRITAEVAGGNSSAANLHYDGNDVNVQVVYDNVGSMTEASLAAAMEGFHSAKIGWGGGQSAPVAGSFSGAAGHAFYVDYEMDEAEADVLWIAGTNPRANDTTADRLNWVLDLAGVDEDDRNIVGGTQICGPTLLDSQSVPDYVRKIGRTEGTPIFVDRLGRITLPEVLPNNPPTSATFDGNEPSGEDWVPYADITPANAVEWLVNDVKITRESGAEQIVVDQPSIDEYGRAAIALETLHATADDARAAGEQIISRRREPTTVTSGIDLAARRKDVPTELTLTAGPGDVSDVRMKPARYSGTVLQRSVTERVAHSFDWQAWDWRVELGMSEHRVLPCFTWGVDGAGWGESVWCEGEP